MRGATHARWLGVRPVREQNHQRPVSQLIDDAAQQIYGGRVGPVQILDHDQKRLLLHAPLDQRPGREHDLTLKLLGLDVPWP
jgi:hypothetical protein